MARIYIEPTKAKRSVQDEIDLSRTLDKLSQEVSSIRSNLRYKISGREQIAARLREVAQQIAKESDSAKALSDGLQQIISKYEQTENANRDRLVADKTSVQTIGSSETEREGGWEPFDGGELIKKIIKEILGPFGIITNYPDLVNGDTSDLAKFLLDSIGSFTKVSSADGGTDVEWLKDLFGFKPMEFTSFKDTFFDKLGKFDTVPDAIGTAADWLEEIIDSAEKNNEEFGGDWCARFWEETLVEAGIKVAEGAAVTAGVSTVIAGICTAAGVACPPFLVVGLAAAGVGLALDWALDGLVSWATNGSCTSWVEGVSDIVCDGIDAIREGAGKVAAKVEETFNNVKDSAVEMGKQVVDSISGGIKNATDAIGDFFSGCKWGGCLFA